MYRKSILKTVISKRQLDRRVKKIIDSEQLATSLACNVKPISTVKETNGQVVANNQESTGNTEEISYLENSYFQFPNENKVNTCTYNDAFDIMYQQSARSYGCGQ